jgi:hypothetical protein
MDAASSVIATTYTMVYRPGVRRREQAFVVVASLALVGVGYALRAAASGIPGKNALSYAGVLEDANGAVSGPHNVQIVVYDAAAAGNVLCQSTTASVDVAAGHFAVQLPDACTTVVANHTDAWVDVLVDGSDTGRTKIGAVPFAVEASHAPNADSAGLLRDRNPGNPHGFEFDWASGLSFYVDGTQVVSGLQGSTISVFAKGGDNGTASCDTYCNGSQWGAVGSCVAAYNKGGGVYWPCSATLPSVGSLDCWCTAPAPY